MRNYLNLSSRKPRTRRDMVEFLTSHPFHSDYMHPSHYARNVKITHLSALTRDERDACFDALEIPWKFSGVQYVLDEFNVRHPGHRIYSGGRSSGWLELWSPDISDDYSDWQYEDVRYLCSLVWDFDKACQEAVDTFVDFAVNNKAEKETA